MRRKIWILAGVVTVVFAAWCLTSIEPRYPWTVPGSLPPHDMVMQTDWSGRGGYRELTWQRHVDSPGTSDEVRRRIEPRMLAQGYTLHGRGPYTFIRGRDTVVVSSTLPAARLPVEAQEAGGNWVTIRGEERMPNNWFNRLRLLLRTKHFEAAKTL